MHYSVTSHICSTYVCSTYIYTDCSNFTQRDIHKYIRFTHTCIQYVAKISRNVGCTGLQSRTHCIQYKLECIRIKCQLYILCNYTAGSVPFTLCILHTNVQLDRALISHQTHITSCTYNSVTHR